MTHDLGTTLARYLSDSLPEANGALHVERVQGGQSNPTYFVTLGERRYVLRARPFEVLPSAHAIDREYRVLRALAGTGLPVPQVHLYCDDASVIGTPFYIMERIEGRIFTQSSLPGVSPQDRSAMYGSVVATLAQLHAVDPVAAGLGDFGKPQAYFARQIARWSRQLEASRDHPTPDLDRLATWLAERIPPENPTTIVHGDFRIPNLVFHPSEPRVVGILDWELSTLGDPLADLAHNAMVYRLPHGEFDGIDGLDLAAAGIPSAAEFEARYAQLTGLPPLTPFHNAFALFRMAVILEGIAARVRSGNAAGADAERVGGFAPLFAAHALRVAEI